MPKSLSSSPLSSAEAAFRFESPLASPKKASRSPTALAVAQLPSLGQLSPDMLKIPSIMQSDLNLTRKFDNDVVTLPEGTVLYRGDDRYDPKQATYEAQFYLRDQLNTKNYGQIVLSFELTQPIELLALDQNVEGFKNWLAQNDTESLNILHNHFGYPKELSQASTHKRVRDSVGNKDRALLNSIKQYAAQHGFKGYYIQQMAHADAGRGDFHGEVAIYDSTFVSNPRLISGQNKDEIRDLNQAAKLKQLEPQKKRKRISQAERIDLDVRENQANRGRGLFG